MKESGQRKEREQKTQAKRACREETPLMVKAVSKHIYSVCFVLLVIRSKSNLSKRDTERLVQAPIEKHWRSSFETMALIDAQGQEHAKTTLSLHLNLPCIMFADGRRLITGSLKAQPERMRRSFSPWSFYLCLDV